MIIALSWSVYNLLRKKINVQADIGLFFETIYILPIALIIFYFIFNKDFSNFTFSDPFKTFMLFLTGPITLVPLYLYLRGVELSGLGVSGMIFFITPSCHFLLGFFYFGEIFDLHKLISFILIWFAVFIYLLDLNKKIGK